MDSTVSDRAAKTLKACEECRRKKQKCNGQTPCGMCIKLRTACSYRTYIRRRRDVGAPSPSLRTLATPRDRNEGSDGPQPSTPPRSMPSRVHIFNNIRATRQSGQARTELFYGSSSPFSLLQHFEVHLPAHTALDTFSEVDTDEFHDGSESIGRYSYQRLAFDNIPIVAQPDTDILIPDYGTAKASLRNFLLTASHRVPFLDSGHICDAFEKMYSFSASVTSDIPKRATVVIALATGAASLTDEADRNNFLKRARKEADSMMYNISLETVQASLMMAQCEFEAGNSNMCYLHLGSAIRKAFAAGIHRVSSLEAKQTIWALYCEESLVCFQLGRNFCLMKEDIAGSLPEKTYMSHFVHLCTIIRSAYRIYSLKGTIATDLSWAKSMDERLHEFSSMLEADMTVKIGGQLCALAGAALSWHITFSYVYHFTRLLVHRPFLLLRLEVKRRERIDGSGYAGDSVTTKQLVDATAVCTESALAIIGFSDSLFSLDIGVKGSYNHAFYLESACFVLGLAAIYSDGSNVNNNFLDRANRGLQLLQKLGDREPVRSVVSASKRMLAQVRDLGVTMSSDNFFLASDADNPNRRTPNANQPFHVGQTDDSLPTSPAIEPCHPRPAPPGWEVEALGDLWSMMDCDVGIQYSDFTTFAPMAGLNNASGV